MPMDADHMTCLEILEFLRSQEHCLTASQVQHETGKSYNSVKDCLEKLVAAGRVEVTKEERQSGRWNCYSVVRKPRPAGPGGTIRLVRIGKKGAGSASKDVF